MKIAGEDIAEMYARVVGSLQGELRIERDQAREAAQAAFVKVWPAYKDGRVDPVAFQHYLYVAARNAYFSPFGRASAVFYPVSLETLGGEDTDQMELPSEEIPPQLARLYRTERRQALDRALGKLPPHREALMRHFLAHPDEPGRVTAAKFSMTPGALRTEKLRAIRHLRLWLRSRGTPRTPTKPLPA